MKRILSYMGAALILVGLISPVTNVPKAPVAHADQQTHVVNVKEDKPKAEVATAPAPVEQTVVDEPEPVLVAPTPPTPQPPTGSCGDWTSFIGDQANAQELIRRESGCNPNAVNPSSGACGVAQELPCGKSGCSLGDGACQVHWMNDYVMARYGSWAAAIAWHNAHNWY